MSEKTLVRDRYELLNPIGDGPNGVVYRATDLKTPGRTLAIKILKEPDSESRRYRFRKEAEILKSLDHPNVITIHDVGTQNGNDWIAMDYAPSGSLAKVLRQDGPFELHGALEVILGILAGLAAAHELGIVHRDVNPENVLLGHRGAIILADFGHARVEGAAQVTRQGSDLQSFPIAAPEQRLDAHQTDARADVYCAAVTLFILLNGRRPPELCTLSPDDPAWAAVPAWLRDVLTRAAALEPDDRYDDAEAFGTALVKAIGRHHHRASELQAFWQERRPTARHVGSAELEAKRRAEAPKRSVLPILVGVVLLVVAAAAAVALLR